VRWAFVAGEVLETLRMTSQLGGASSISWAVAGLLRFDPLKTGAHGVEEKCG
jgi:hypothetical protein